MLLRFCTFFNVNTVSLSLVPPLTSDLVAFAEACYTSVAAIVSQVGRVMQMLGCHYICENK